MVLDNSLLNTQQYKVRIKSKVEQSRERSSPLPNTSVRSYWKGSLLVTLDYGRQLYIYLHPPSDCLFILQLISVASHAKCFKTASVLAWLYISRISYLCSIVNVRVSERNFKVYIHICAIVYRSAISCEELWIYMCMAADNPSLVCSTHSFVESQLFSVPRHEIYFKLGSYILTEEYSF